MVKHMLIKLLIDMDSEWFHLALFGLLWYAWCLAICWTVCIWHCLHMSIFNSHSIQNTHKTCVLANGRALNNMVVVCFAWLRLPFFKYNNFPVDIFSWLRTKVCLCPKWNKIKFIDGFTHSMLSSVVHNKCWFSVVEVYHICFGIFSVQRKMNVTKCFVREWKSLPHFIVY